MGLRTRTHLGTGRHGSGAWLLAIILVACTAPTSPTSTSTAPTTTATTVAPSTSTSTTAAVEGPVDICVPGISSWELGGTYVAPCFLTQLQFMPVDEGWSSIQTATEWIEGMWTEPDERTPAIRFVILAYEPQANPDEVIASILAIESIDPLSQPTQDRELLSVDVTTGPDADIFGRECMVTFTRAFDILGGSLGTVLLDRLNNVAGGAGRTYGMGACWTFRIWATTVADTTITVIATAADLDRFDELMPAVERLVATIEPAGS